MRILTVDGDSTVRELLRRWLVGWGYQVSGASSATDALAMMEAEPADIMLCDVYLPGHDGLWLAENVREAWPRTAVLIASGVIDKDVAQRAQRLGAVDYITKPFGCELLRQAISRATLSLEGHPSRQGDE
jgi:DNA-binding NtrC family response regulator